MVAAKTKLVIRRQDACQIEFTVSYKGHLINMRYWIITGGEPALGVEGEYGLQKRYELLPDYDKANWERYKPMLETIGGEAEVYNYLDTVIPRLELRRARKALLPADVPNSPRFHDTANNVYFRCHYNVHSGYVGPVTCTSKIYSGRCEKEIQSFANQPWKDLANFINPLFDNFWESGALCLEHLTEPQFQTYKGLVEAVINTHK